MKVEPTAALPIPATSSGGQTLLASTQLSALNDCKTVPVLFLSWNCTTPSPPALTMPLICIKSSVPTATAKDNVASLMSAPRTTAFSALTRAIRPVEPAGAIVPALKSDVASRLLASKLTSKTHFSPVLTSNYKSGIVIKSVESILN